MLVDRRIKRLEIPGEPGEWIELRRLAFGELRELRQQSGERFLEELSGLPADVIEMQLTVQAKMAAAKREALAAAEAAGEDPGGDLPDPDVLDGMDLLYVLRHGIVAWSYCEASGEPVPVDELTVAMLDEETARWAAREVLLLGEEVAEREKKGSPSSIATSTE